MITVTAHGVLRKGGEYPARYTITMGGEHMVYYADCWRHPSPGHEVTAASCQEVVVGVPVDAEDSRAEWLLDVLAHPPAHTHTHTHTHTHNHTHTTTHTHTHTHTHTQPQTQYMYITKSDAHILKQDVSL